MEKIEHSVEQLGLGSDDHALFMDRSGRVLKACEWAGEVNGLVHSPLFNGGKENDWLSLVEKQDEFSKIFQLFQVCQKGVYSGSGKPKFVPTV